MHRVLRRPMFRAGGAEGLTSGLDNPQLTASRLPYKRGRVVEPGGYKGEEEEYARMKKILDEVRGERRPQWPQFLTSFGLDLLSRPPQGNIFQTAAAAAKGPYEQWMGARAERGISEDKLSTALFGDVMDIEFKKEKLLSEEKQATIKAAAEKEFDIGQAAKIAKLSDEMYQKKLDLENELGVLQVITDPSEEDLARIQQIEKAELPSTISNIAQLEGAESIIEQINAAGQIDAFNDLIDRYESEEGMSYDEAFLAAIKFYEGIFSRMGKREEDPFAGATGGRVGYQNAGAVMPNTIPRAMPAVMPGPGPTDQGQDDTVQDLSFEELRARLPQEITNDIVKLLSESKQALVDFANIRTQQDVNEFNQKYDVNLVVPQEV